MADIGIDYRLDLGNANNAAPDAGTSVARWLAQLVSTLAKIIGIGVHDNGASDDAVGAEERNLGVGDFDLGGAVAGGLNVAQIAQVTILVDGSAMLLAIRIEVRSGRHAAIGVVTELVHVESVQTLGQAAHLTGDLHGRTAALWTGWRDWVITLQIILEYW